MPIKSLADLRSAIAFMIVVGYFAIVFVWMFHPPAGDPAALAVLNNLVGAWTAAFITICGYFFGSTRSSNAKDDTIGTLAANTTNASHVVSPTPAPLTPSPQQSPTPEKIT